MKTTIITKCIDDQDIIVGFDRALIDPVATRLKVLKALQDSGIVKALNQTAQDITQLKQNIVDSDAAQNEKIRMTLHSKIDKMAALQLRYSEKVESFFESECVYFEPKKGEYIIDTDSEAASLVFKFENLADNKRLTRIGKTIDDFRGVSYWQQIKGQWTRNTITKLNTRVPINATLETEITEEIQFEIDHQTRLNWIAGLSESERATEQAAALDIALNEALKKRRQWEIEGVTEAAALIRSKDWFAVEKREIERLFNAG